MPKSQRERALAHVVDLVKQYRYKALHPANEIAARFYRERLAGLTREIGLLQVAGPEGDQLSRRWCAVTPP